MVTLLGLPTCSHYGQVSESAGAAMAKLGQQISDHKVGICIVFALFILFVLFAFVVWRRGWDWTGFKQYTTKTITVGHTITEIHPSKTLWDVLELAIIPVVLVGVAYALNQAQRKSDLVVEEHREQKTVLQNYLDRMTELMLEHRLGKLKPGHEIERYLDEMKRLVLEGELDQAKDTSLRDELWSGLDNKVRTIARTLTLTTLQRLNGERKGILLRFLYEADLILVKGNTLAPPLVLRGADLTRADLSKAFLIEADLTGVNLGKAILTETCLSGSILTDANLTGAKLRRAYLRRADLAFAKLSRACLNKADLYGANLQKSSLGWANLRDADLRDADLRGADLRRAKLRGANLEGVVYDNRTVWPKGFAPPPEAVRTDKQDC
jgi:uncharacterized protein YjbI with pentapeptide repeats